MKSLGRQLSPGILGLLLMIAVSGQARVYSGLEVFLSRHSSLVAGQRVGLVTNPTGVNAQLQATVDLLRRHPGVNLVALFAPEHGIRGDIAAGAQVPGGRDPISKLPIYTLYGGRDHKPPPEGMAKIDVMIFDIQDVGSRAYTYIWHMAECMSACAAAGKPFIVLDRPNIYGGMVIDGPVSERQYLSFIGLYPIPRVYGMSAGELARYLNREERIGCKLYVIPMVNYRRGMSWDECGLPWVPTSPHVPDPESAYCFAATGTLGELGVVNIGIGYTLPFKCVAAPWINADHMAASLNGQNLPGIRFRPVHYKPFYGMFSGRNIQGVQLHIIEPERFRPSTTEIAILCYLRKNYPRFARWDKSHSDAFDKAMGTAKVRHAVESGQDWQNISASWTGELRSFDARRRKYLIYK